MKISIKTESYIDDFENILILIDDANDAKERYEHAIAIENNGIRELKEQVSNLEAELVEMKDEFANKFVDLYKKSSKSVKVTCENSCMNIRLKFLDKYYKLFNRNFIYINDIDSIIDEIIKYIYKYINTNILTFDSTVQELSDLYAKYEVNPEFIKNQMLKICNSRKVKELKQYIESCKLNIDVSKTSLEKVQSQLSNEVVKPTLFNKLFHKKQLMLQEQEIRLDANITYLKDEIRKSEQKLAEINENPEKNLDFVESELQALSDFLDIYELVDKTKEKISSRQVNIHALNEKIQAKKSWISDYEKEQQNQELRIEGLNKQISKLCEQLSKDKLSFKELSENTDNETIKKLLENYEAYIANSIEKTI